METLPKDVSFVMMDKLDDNSLLNFCLTNKRNKELCNNETFWRNRTLKKYGEYVKYKSPDRTWKNYYISLIYYLNLQRPPYSSRLNYMIRKAAENNDMDIVSLAVDMGAFLDYGYSAAAMKGHKKLVEFFIEKLIEKNIRKPSMYGGTETIYENGLAFASAGGHKDLIEFFIKKGAHNWNLGMSYAAEGGHKDLINFFIEKGANDWEVGLVKAAIGGHKDLVDFFIQKGAIQVKNSVEMTDNEEMKKYLETKYSHLIK